MTEVQGCCKAPLQALALAAGLLFRRSLPLFADAQPRDETRDALPRALRPLLARSPRGRSSPPAAADERALDAVAGGKLGRRGTDPSFSFLPKRCARG